MPRGGKRPNSGPKVGSKFKGTIAKEAARDALRQIVLRHMDRLVAAQIANGLGLSHLFIRDKTGKFVQITDPEQIETILNSGEQDKYFYIHTKDPSVQAFTDLMNRALDKPKEQEAEIKLTGDADLIAKLLAGRRRAADGRAE